MTAKLLHRPAAMVPVTVDGVEIRLPRGMMLASALATADVLRLRAAPAQARRAAPSASWAPARNASFSRTACCGRPA